MYFYIVTGNGVNWSSPHVRANVYIQVRYCILQLALYTYMCVHVTAGFVSTFVEKASFTENW